MLRLLLSSGDCKELLLRENQKSGLASDLQRGGLPPTHCFSLDERRSVSVH
jgi:hypothetical protein